MVMTAPSHIPNTPRRRLLVGAALPQNEIGNDPDILRDFAQGIEALGFNHLVIYDHVLGADTSVHKGDFLYSHKDAFHEPFVTLGFLAGATRHLGFATSVLVLAQRQTALVAKQAAELDLLLEGRFRFGVGLGWNEVEYEALGQDFSTRGRRLDEQVALLRRYWTERSVTFEGEFDRVTGAGIAPMPLQQPIPIWFGGGSKPAFRRMGRLADGWYPMMTPGPELDEAMTTIATAAEAAGRDPKAIGMEGRITWTGDLDQVKVEAEQWRALDASHVSINTMGSGLTSIDAHVDVLATVAQALELR